MVNAFIEFRFRKQREIERRPDLVQARCTKVQVHVKVKFEKNDNKSAIEIYRSYFIINQLDLVRTKRDNVSASFQENRNKISFIRYCSALSFGLHNIFLEGVDL